MLRRPEGVWPLPGFGLFVQTRDALSARCVREPSAPEEPAVSGSLLDDVRARVELVYTELASDALRHGSQPTRVRLASTAQTWLLSIDDSAPERAPLSTAPAPPYVPGALTPATAHLPGPRPGPDPLPAPGGAQTNELGQVIVETVSSSAGWYPHGNAKTVWAEIPDAPPADLINRLADSGKATTASQDVLAASEDDLTG